MKIAIVAGPHVPVPPIKYGGSELVIYYLIKGLKKLGHEPILFAAADSSIDCELVPITNKSIFFPKSTSELPKFTKLELEIEKQTAKQLKKFINKVDIIHSHGFDLSKFNIVPNVTTLHNPITYEAIPYYLKRKHLNWIAISKDYKNSFPSLNYLSVIYNGEDSNDYEFVEKPQDYVCFVGRFDTDKNPHHAIELALSHNQKIKLAGKTDFRSLNYFKENIKPYLNNPLVEYLGEITIKEKNELIRNAKCNLHPVGFREPFGLTVLEAAYSGTPTLAIRKGSMPELIEDGKTGILVDDFVEGYSKLLKCFSMDRKYISISARKKFDYIKMAKSYVRAYEKAIKNFNSSKIR